MQQNGTKITSTADDIADKYNAKILFQPGKWMSSRSISSISFKCDGFFFQMIHECAIQYANRFVWAFGQSQKGSSPEVLQKHCKLNRVASMPVSIDFIWLFEHQQNVHFFIRAHFMNIRFGHRRQHSISF